MKILTSKATGIILDWAVTKALGTEIGEPENSTFDEEEFALVHSEGDFNWSTEWAQGGPIIEEEEIEVGRYWNRAPADPAAWKAQRGAQVSHQFGPTPLIAAMRCYVTSKLGAELHFPQELLR